MAPLSLPLTWTLSSGILPTGLSLMKLDEKLLITGIPLVAGVFPFQVEVVDARGRSDTAELVLEVLAPAIEVKGDVPDQVVPNQTVSVQFTVVGPAPDRIA